MEELFREYSNSSKGEWDLDFGVLGFSFPTSCNTVI